MRSPFPGMDPYLEHPQVWPGVHHLSIGELVRLLSPQLRPKYRVAVEVRMYEASNTDNSLSVVIPDVAVKREQATSYPSTSPVAVLSPPTAQPATVMLPMPETVKQGYLEILDVATKEVITTIEILSPTNKRAGEGRKAYLAKRRRIFRSATHLVEIDLLRSAKPMPVLDDNVESDYRILVSRSDRRPLADLYHFNVRDAIPSFSLPLQSGDTEPVIDLQPLLNSVYDLGGFDTAVDYAKEPIPKISKTDAEWVDALLKQQSLR
ncbi:MAG: DUF4058 family protein [Cyanobacteriota bacterium]|nr:DUF4058 family protein [Cyanobacteriota bacterium]